MNEINFLDELPENDDNSQLHKMNLRDLVEQLLILDDETKIRMLKMLFCDLNLLNVVNASKKIGITPNGVRKTKDIIKLDNKEFTKI